MIPGINTSPKELEAIQSAFATWAEHFRHAFYDGGLEFLLESYETLVSSLEKGECAHSSDYASCCGDFYEFTNDLSVRNAIQHVLDAVSEAERTRIQRLVGPIDERYHRTQVGDDFFLSDGAKQLYANDKYWWYYGLPRGIHR